MRLQDDFTSVLAISFGALLGVGITVTALSRESAPADRIRETVPLLVASRPLEVGTVLTPADLKVVEWPGSAYPTGFVSSPTQVVGLTVRAPFLLHEVIRAKKLGRDELGAVAAQIPDGYRAFSVRVDDRAAVAGWVRPGARVDVLATPDAHPVDGGIRPVLQDALVLGNDRSIARTEDGGAAATALVTLLVTRADAERLEVATRPGHLHVVLRSSR